MDLRPDDVAAIEDELIAIRRDLHRHPETAFEERRTADVVAARLAAWGLDVHRGLAGTGVVGTLVGRRPGGRPIGLRADMDALDLQEENRFAHRSTIAGKMHGCGHDGHVAMLLGAALTMAAERDFAGTVHFIFQPAEEGDGGARVMVEDGLFDRFPCDAIFGLHNLPGLGAGDFALCVGPMMAASDRWQVTFRGAGGHGSSPQHAADPTMPAAAFVLALQGIVGRNVAPDDAAVISVGHVGAGAAGAPGVIPAEAVVQGIARSFTPAVRDLIERRLAEVAQGIAAAWGCAADVRYRRSNPALVNAAGPAGLAVAAAAATVGADRVDDMMAPLTGAEDFAFMLEHRPGAYIMIGNGLMAGGGAYLHSPVYDFNDAVIRTGVAYWVNLARRAVVRP